MIRWWGMGKTQEYIKLDQFLKWQDLADSGGQAKLLIRAGRVRVNGVIETRRGRKLYAGDTVKFDDLTLTVEME